MITYETRRESHETVDKEKRYEQIMAILKDKPMTAKEIAVEMCRLGLTPNSERNFSAPRLTELVDKGMVKTIGKKVCDYTGKKVTIYCVI
jgi:predicted HTH transcriptional regulator